MDHKAILRASVLRALARATIAAAAVSLSAAPSAAQQTETPPKAARPAQRPSFADTVKKNLQRIGATVDEGRSKPEMVVSNFTDDKENKVTVVVINYRGTNLIGFYIYNFGNLKDAAQREDIYKHLLTTNDAITIGSFFVDTDSDIGYKYLMNASLAQSASAFDSVYKNMATVAIEQRAKIREMLGLAPNKEDRSQDPKKAAEEKPPR
ncbi:MAG TPA: hypothetical protein VJQ56_01435 [Blastocatellia bacterium]|nr:hypothetical protein [Blastocatellia bacterium]